LGGGARMKRAALLATALLAAVQPAGAAARAPTRSAPPLSRDTARVDISSTFGSGSFGSWYVDPLGLPAYRYTIDEQTASHAAQPELAGSRAAWHQLGNDHVVADAFNDGYAQLWSQDKMYQWTNEYASSSDHFSGGYGYFDLAGHSYSTLYPDRAPGERIERDFGLGYAQTIVRVRGLTATERVYAPFGDDPLLLHDVTLRNTSKARESPTWFEYWDVNPVMPPTGVIRGTASPAYDAATRTLSVAQLPTAQDLEPLSIFAAALQAPVDGYDTDTSAFFGGGGGRRRRR
jgi:hypothetical protein